MASTTRCRWNHKFAHRTRQDARNVKASMAKAGEDVKGLQPYHCPAGHWHLGHRTKKENPVTKRRPTEPVKVTYSAWQFDPVSEKVLEEITPEALAIARTPVDTLVWPEEIPEPVRRRLGDNRKKHLSDEVRRFVMARDGWKCVRCLRERVEFHRRTLRARRVVLTIDHIVPRRDGGISHPDNLRVLCWRCHNEHNKGEW